MFDRPSQPPTDATRLGRPRLVAGLVAVPVLAIALAACSSGSHGSSQSTGAAAPVANGSARPGAGQRGPAAFGVAAAIDGTTIEVQDPSTGQVSVVYGTSTRFSQQRSTTVGSLAVGQCVTASAPSTSSGSAAPSSRPTTFTATAITVVPAVNGTCSGAGFGGGSGFGGGRPSGSARPSGAPPSGAARGRFGDFATGTLKSISGSTLTIQAQDRQGGTTTDTITVTSATTVTETVSTTSAALKVGECVTATGSTGTTGTVSATRIALSTPGPNGCTSGFGRRGFGGGSGGGGSSGGGNTNA
ncbi:MAG TPA: hypothetical protein VMB79_00435 [Jatrophihabitans sp.]|nr:hypothetical protein [Jatrophihabitans sp.]